MVRERSAFLLERSTLDDRTDLTGRTAFVAGEP